MALQDSGNRKQFATGAARDCREGVGRCDLLPLKEIAYFISRDKEFDSILSAIEDYIRTGNPDYLYQAINIFRNTLIVDRYTLVLDVSKHYEEGAKKYEDRNWEKGIPLHCFIDSGVRHYLKWLRGDDDEPHERAFVWNMLGAIWTHKNKPEMIDLPFKGDDVM